MLDFVFIADFLLSFGFSFGEGYVHLTSVYTVVDFGVKEIASRGLTCIFC